ncbi:RNaseH domain-containing protein [Rossellomorea aquimaris]|uniref:DUF3893 domain-containing protein n=1 Tax=Rossellomorea aquimaris TaxID=189382 RepID=A0A5D4TB15_9BACI|nr:RNaseH domain-containing protein [Rossellomorea aquimaris]TYS71642.1 DUF3893 domain-containing protein [Rossellomorea aquimaris]
MITTIETFEQELNSLGIKKYLQPLTYKISPEYLKSCEVNALYMPDKWAELTKEIFYKKYGKWQLTDILDLLLQKHPYIFHYSLSQSSYIGDTPFLYIATEYYTEEVLDSVAMDLLTLLKESNRSFNWGIDNPILNSFVLDPKMEQKTLYEIVSSGMGTFQIISGYFTHKLCKKPVTLALELYHTDHSSGERKKVEESFNSTLNYAHTKTNSKHEAVSNIVEVAGGYCSFVFSLSFVEFAGQEGWYLNLKTNVRQWIVSPLPTKYNSFTKEASVYVGSFSKENKGNVLMHTSLKASKSSNDPSYVIPLIHQEALKKLNITIEGVLDNTRNYVENGKMPDRLFIGIPYSYSNASWWEGHRSFLRTGNGVALEEDRNFYYRITEVLDGLETIPGIRDVESSKFKVKAKQTSKKIPFSHMTVPKNINQLTINIFSADSTHYEDIRDILFNEVQDEKLPEGYEKFPFRNKEEAVIQFENKKVPVVLKSRGISNAHRLYSDDYEKKVQSVYEEIAGDLDINCVNLFFLPDYQKLTSQTKQDPYRAIREAFARHGQHVQFINYRFGESSKHYHPNRNIDKESNKLQRYRHAFLDCLSKQGITQTFTSPLEDSVLELGVMEEKLFNKRVLFMTRHQGERIQIKIAGFTPWVSYDKAAGLFDSLQFSKRKTPRIDESFVLENIMNEVNAFDGEVLLYLPAKLRKKISWLGNKRFSKEQNPLSNIPKINLIRYNNWEDVPSYFTRGYKDKEEKWSNTQPKGLFPLNPTSFLSLADRGDQIRYQLGKSRLTAEEEENYRRKRLVEFAILNGEKYTAEELANYAHGSRRQNISFNSFTNLPQILFWIQQLVGDFK